MAMYVSALLNRTLMVSSEPSYIYMQVYNLSISNEINEIYKNFEQQLTTKCNSNKRNDVSEFKISVMKGKNIHQLLQKTCTRGKEQKKTKKNNI